MPGRVTELSETQIVADLLADRRRQAAATTSVQMPQPAKDTFTVAATPATTYQLNAIPYQGSGGSSLNLSLNGVELIEGVDYTVDYTTAIVTVTATLTGTPTPADVLTADYWTTGDLIAATGTATTGTVTDNFNRANSSTLGTTSDGSATWVQQVGTYGITSNQAVVATRGTVAWLGTNPVTIATINVGSGDGTVQVKSTLTGQYQGLVFRWSDASNYWVWYYLAGSGMYLVKVVGGSAPFPGNYVINNGTATINAGDTMQVQMSGSSITLVRQGSTVGTVTDSFNSTATNVGLFQEDDGVHNYSVPFDDFNWTG